MSWAEVVAREIRGTWTVINAVSDGFWDFLARGEIFRRASFVFMWYLTFEAYQFCYEAAKAAAYDPAAIVACIGILTPVSALQAVVFKFYSHGKKVNTGTEPKV